MRVVAGSAGGRRLQAPPGSGVRPTADRVKEAWFSSLAPRLAGAAVLDLYAGSGALGIEAASRGAGRVVAVEQDGRARAVLADNVTTTGLAVEVVAGALPGALAGLVGPFDVVLADPPYRQPQEDLALLLDALLPLLADDGEVWLERDRRAGAPPWPAALRPGRVRTYGDTALHRAVHEPGGRQ